MDGASALTLADLLRDRASRFPRRDVLRMRGRTLTFRELDRDVDRLTDALAFLGVEPGDTVGVMMHNCPEFATLWLACMRMGAIEAPVNTAFRGVGLAHLLDLCGCRLLVADEEFLAALGEVRSGLARLERVITRHELAELAATAAGEPRPHKVDPRQPAQIFFTSGTTGRSKACVFDSRYTVRQAQIFARQWHILESDVLYNPFPLFHIDASVLTLAPAIARGCTAALGEKFSASGFWDEVRELGATVFDYMGATLTMLWKTPQRATDADNDVRLAWGVPMPDFAEEFEQRFGLRLVEAYGLTDAGVPVYQPLDEPRRPGSCGKVVPEYSLAIAGDGEILVRAHEPGLTALGYLGDEEATAAAFAGDWFRTGDLGRVDEEGWVYFTGRKKDAIRRRGENISAFEVEEVVEAHPAVLEAAAFGLPSEMTEEDVMVCAVLRPDAALTPDELVTWCEARMARHMVPRFVEFVDALPRTPTEKVEKYRLRDRGVTARTWDRSRVARQGPAG
jgi:crotonobetaine/carnitine-CoA ligase